MKKIMGIASAVALVAVAAPAAHAATTVKDIRQADFVPALSDTRSAGSYTFLEDGIRVVTQGNTTNDKVAEYVAASGAIPTSGSYVWYGTSIQSGSSALLGQPGLQIVFDLDGDRTNANSFNVLVGEQVYSTNQAGQPLTDFWYTGGKARADARGIKCPSNSTGFGSDCHGTLAEWASELPQAQMYATGFSLGSGVKGDGVLRSITVGDTEYDFTSVPAAAQGTGSTTPTTGTTPTTSTTAPVVKDVTGTFSSKKSKVRVKVKFTADALVAGTAQGKKIQWKVKLDRTTALKLTQGAGDTDVFKTPRLKGKHVVQVFKDGVLVKTIKFRGKA